MQTTFKCGLWFIALLIAAFFLFYLPFVNHVSANHIGLAYDSLSGEVHMQQPGFHVTAPTTLCTTLTTLPFRVSIPTNARLVNMRMVRFKPEGFKDYIATQGWEYLGNESEFQNIMLGYAFSDQEWSFMEVSKPDAAGLESMR